MKESTANPEFVEVFRPLARELAKEIIRIFFKDMTKEELLQLHDRYNRE